MWGNHLALSSPCPSLSVPDLTLNAQLLKTQTQNLQRKTGARQKGLYYLCNFLRSYISQKFFFSSKRIYLKCKGTGRDNKLLPSDSLLNSPATAMAGPVSNQEPRTHVALPRGWAATCHLPGSINQQELRQESRAARALTGIPSSTWIQSWFKIHSLTFQF